MPLVDDAHDPNFPHEEVQRMQHAMGSVRLLSEKLEPFVYELGRSMMVLVGAATKDDDTFTAAHGNAAEVEGRFQRAAYEELKRVEPSRWARVRSRLGGTKPGTPSSLP
jgi:hypothetical protein